jgi:hypothetical protein
MPKLGYYQSSLEKSEVQEKFDVVSISFLLLLGAAPFTKFQDAEKSHFERGIDRNSIVLSNYPILLFLKIQPGHLPNLFQICLSSLSPILCHFS